MSDSLLSVENLVKHFPVFKGAFRRRAGTVRAVDGVSFELKRGETLALVGESGCGKTTAGKTILRLLAPTSGRVLFRDLDLAALNGARLRGVRKHMQIIFQDPYSSLNPRQTIGQVLTGPLLLHGLVTPTKAEQKARDLLEMVGLQPSYISRYPHEFSGGQRQRIGIARAVALEPDFIVCDEAVSALDVSVQAQIINLLADLKDRLGLSYLFIAHDLSVVRHFADRVAVMYLGKIVELGTTAEIFSRPQHPYTQALLSAVPNPDPRQRKRRIILRGDVPSPMQPPSGCRFHTRCRIVETDCRGHVPLLEEQESGHQVRCFLAAEGRSSLESTLRQQQKEE